MTVQQRMSTREAAAYTGLSARTLEKLRITGGGPEYLKITPTRRVAYDREALDGWLASKRRRSTSDSGEAA